jgi:dihydroneopterin aldolase
MDKIILTGISAIGFHGVHDFERKNGQMFSVDLEIGIDLSKAGKNDELSETIDYSSVVGMVINILTGQPVNLIEKIGELVCEEILKNFLQANSVIVVVHKPDAPVGAEILDVAVRIERSR